MKICTSCKQELDESNFWKNKSTKDGLQSQCKTCWQAVTNRYLQGDTRLKYLRIRRNRHLVNKYGITLEEYEVMLKKQNGVCYICKGKPEDKNMAVDHCHDTGKVRGILCENCNRGIGMFKHNVTLLKSAINYLQNT
jgi:hypothetical protein